MVKVEVVMDERELLARQMLNLRLIKLSWALLNFLRLILKIHVSKLTIGLGALGLLLGVATYYNLSGFSIWAAVVLIIGFFMLFELLKK